MNLVTTHKEVIFDVYLHPVLNMPDQDPKISDIDVMIYTNISPEIAKYWKIETDYYGEWRSFPLIQSTRFRHRVNNAYKSFNYRVTPLGEDLSPLYKGDEDSPEEITPAIVRYDTERESYTNGKLNWRYGRGAMAAVSTKARKLIELTGEEVAIVYRNPVERICSCYNFNSEEADPDCPICHGSGAYNYGFVRHNDKNPMAAFKVARFSKRYETEGRIPDFSSPAFTVYLPRIFIKDILIRKDPYGYGHRIYVIEGIERPTMSGLSSIQQLHMEDITDVDTGGEVVPRYALENKELWP